MIHNLKNLFVTFGINKQNFKDSILLLLLRFKNLKVSEYDFENQLRFGGDPI